MPKQTDFPCPPKAVEIAFDFQSNPQRYDREGSIDDAAAAILGTGAFGAAYRYVKSSASGSTGDDSLASSMSTQASSRIHESQLQDYSSPPSSMEEEVLKDGDGVHPTMLKGRRRPGTTGSKKQGSVASASREQIEDLGGKGSSATDGRTPDTKKEAKLAPPSSQQGRSRSTSVLRSAASLPQLKQAAQQSLSSSDTKSEPRPSDEKHPSSIVIKLCRTPITGSFDELPRQQRNANNKPKAGWHIRIVRGEGRLFRYLQKAQALEFAQERTFHSGSDKSYAGGTSTDSRELDTVDNTFTVRLLADLPADGHVQGQIFNLTPQSSVGNSLSLMSSAVRVQAMDSHSRPPYRMLAFEELVDLDAELVNGSWVKGTQAWTAQQVENAARETAMGLKFLHEHAIVHSDLKPANLMRDPRSGVVKLIDLGAARRFVRIEDQFKHSTTIVEERDAAMNSAEEEATVLRNTLCEGLTSLTGSPHFMAPEILLQASRYTDKDGVSRSTLKDHKRNPAYLPGTPSVQWLRLCLDDYAVGWGIKADIWSWGCCVMLAPLKDRNNTALICPFDFTFDDGSDALHPLHELGPAEKSLPHFHLWARIYPLRIQDIVAEGARITAKAQECMSPSLTRMVIASLRHHSVRPTASQICEALLPSSATRPAFRQNRHSFTEVPRPRLTDTPKTLAESLASESSHSTSHRLVVPTAPKLKVEEVVTVSSGASDAAAMGGAKMSQQQPVQPEAEANRSLKIETKDLPTSPEMEGRRRFTMGEYSNQSSAGAGPAIGSLVVQDGSNAGLKALRPNSGPSKNDARSGNKSSTSVSNDDRGALSHIASALGIQLGKINTNAAMLSVEGGDPSSPSTRTGGRFNRENLSPSPAAADQFDANLLSPPNDDGGKRDKTQSARQRLSKASGINLRFMNMLSSMSSRDRSHSSSGASHANLASTSTSHTSEKRLSSRSTAEQQAEKAKLPTFTEPVTPPPSTQRLQPQTPVHDDRSFTESLLSSNHGPGSEVATPPRRDRAELAGTPTSASTGLSPFTASDAGTSPSAYSAAASPQLKVSIESPSIKFSIGAGQYGENNNDDEQQQQHAEESYPSPRLRTQSSLSLVESIRSRAGSMARRAKNVGRADPGSPTRGAHHPGAPMASSPLADSSHKARSQRRMTATSVTSMSSSFGTGLGQGVEAAYLRNRGGATTPVSPHEVPNQKRQSVRSNRGSLVGNHAAYEGGGASGADAQRRRTRLSTGEASISRSQLESNQSPAASVERQSSVKRVSGLLRRRSGASFSSRSGRPLSGESVHPPLPTQSLALFNAEGSSSTHSHKGNSGTKNVLGLGIQLGAGPGDTKSGTLIPGSNHTQAQVHAPGNTSRLRSARSLAKISSWYAAGPLSPSRAHHQVASSSQKPSQGHGQAHAQGFIATEPPASPASARKMRLMAITPPPPSQPQPPTSAAPVSATVHLAAAATAMLMAPVTGRSSPNPSLSSTTQQGQTQTQNRTLKNKISHLFARGGYAAAAAAAPTP
ncbi:hypothetical protein OC844_005464 [Tilletia horrida]|nr:hypothetical protein OC844_005464 [Tilletia horrida]